MIPVAGNGSSDQAEPIVTGNGNIQLFKRPLQPLMCFIYTQNDENLLYHYAEIIRNWLEEHSGEFQRRIWLLNLQDINLIERSWDMIEKSVNYLSSIAQNHVPSNGGCRSSVVEYSLN
ncbi:hypothetical protein TNCV_2979341 [Trichonephila clavipes]|nr:hypothetical protein TNCV_2979341 [Trichonephila clavipes]